MTDEKLEALKKKWAAVADSLDDWDVIKERRKTTAYWTGPGEWTKVEKDDQKRD